jgi:hypothetical protein
MIRYFVASAMAKPANRDRETRPMSWVSDSWIGHKMTMKESMFSATGGGHWSARILDDPVQDVSQRYQIIHRCYNTGAHYGFEVNLSIAEERHRVWSHMRKGQGGDRSSDRHIELSVAQYFWHIFWVGWGRLFGLDHNKIS